jgi:hypothetical protein
MSKSNMDTPHKITKIGQNLRGIDAMCEMHRWLTVGVLEHIVADGEVVVSACTLQLVTLVQPKQ